MNILKILKPINLEEEQKKFVNSNSYNPIFKYEWTGRSVDDWLSKQSQQKYIPLVNAVRVQDYQRIGEEGEKIFSTKMDSDILQKAEEIIKKSRKQLKSQSIEDLVNAYKDAFVFFDIDYEIRLSDERGFAVRPSHSNKVLLINKHLNLTYDSYQGITRHEILHIIRSINTEHNGIEKSEFYLPTEEGLASYVQNVKATEENYSLFQHASRYLATNISLHGTFRDVVNYLKKIGIEDGLAFRRAVRHKSGFIDTAQPGDTMKSSMYFYNLQKVSQMSDSEKLRLFVGKIAIEDLPKYAEYRGKIDRDKIIDYFNLSI
jgi:hypothetical protein